MPLDDLNITSLPCEGQNRDTVKRWVESKPLQAGDIVIVRNTQGHVTEYRKAFVEKVNHGRQRRVILKDFGSFYRDGRNCFHPKGQTTFIVPTPELNEAAERRITWVFGQRQRQH